MRKSNINELVLNKLKKKLYSKGKTHMKKIYLNKQCGGTKYKASEMKDKSLN